VDTLGWLLLVWVSTAAGQDRAGARTLWARWRHQFSRLALIWADGGDAGKLVPRVWGLRRWRKIRLEIVPRLGGNRLVVLPKRWIGERTIGWWMKWRRLRGDYEQRTDQSEAFIYIAMIGRMTRRLARKKKNSKTRSERCGAATGFRPYRLGGVRRRWRGRSQFAGAGRPAGGVARGGVLWSSRPRLG